LQRKTLNYEDKEKEEVRNKKGKLCIISVSLKVFHNNISIPHNADRMQIEFLLFIFLKKVICVYVPHCVYHMMYIMYNLHNTFYVKQCNLKNNM